MKQNWLISCFDFCLKKFVKGFFKKICYKLFIFSGGAAASHEVCNFVTFSVISICVAKHKTDQEPVTVIDCETSNLKKLLYL